MKIIKRDYVCKDFQYNGKLQIGKGAYPQLSIGFAIQNAETNPLLDVVFDYSYNNYDASVQFIVQGLVNVDFEAKTPVVDEIWDEIKLQSADFWKLLKMECTQANKHQIPPEVDVEQMKEKLLPVIWSEIDELF